MKGFNLNMMLGVIVGLLTIVVTLSMAPNIGTANTAVAAWGDNSSYMIGLGVVTDFGAPICILGLLAMGGLFTYGAWKGSTNLNMSDILSVVGITVIVIVGLTFMATVCQKVKDLVGATTTDFEDVIYGIIPLFVYMVIISLPFVKSYTSWRGGRKGKRAKAQANF